MAYALKPFLFRSSSVATRPRSVALGHLLVLRHRVVLKDFALEDPDLDAAGAERGERGRHAVIDIGAQRVRRHATRRSSCWAIDSATSVASSSGLRIATMLMTTSDAVISATRLRSLSMSAPFLPITTPGRAEWIVTRHFLCGRSITILATAACLSSLCRISRILTSSWSSLPYSFLPANQRESHVRLMPRRSPIGLIF